MNRLAQKKKVCALIPARLNSVRFPGKALKQIDGIPMVVRVLAAARDSGVFDAVYAATDSPEIAAVCQTYGFEAVFASHSHQNPTSRIQEAVTILEDSKSTSSRKFDFYAMIGGDEPLLTPEILQNFMEQALTVITSKETCTTSISHQCHGRYPEQCRDSRSIQHKSSLPPGRHRALHFPCANSIPQGDA